MMLYVQINLLPEDERPTQGGGAPLMLIALVLIAGVAGLGWLNYDARQKSHDAATSLATKTLELTALTAQEAALLVVEKEIETLHAAEDRLLAVMSEKTPWGLKLRQLQDALPDGVWIRAVDLEPGDHDAPAVLALSLEAVADPGADPARRVDEVTRALLADAEFGHAVSAPERPTHFTATPPAGGGRAFWRIAFTIRLPLS